MCKMKKFVTAFLCASMLFGLTACGDKKETPKPDQQTGQESNQGNESVQKTLTATTKGHNADLTVEVVMDGDTIKEVNVTKHEESAGISDPAINDLPKQIVENQSVAVDTIAGCTVSSAAVIEAVKAALTSGGYDINAFSKEIAEAQKGEVETLTADVVIVGGGGAGLAAAASALENGASVIIVEKMASLGGNTSAADGLYNAVDPERQGAMGIEDSVEQFYEDTFVGGDEKAKPELVKTLTENAMESLYWLEGMGLKMDSKIYTGTGALWPRGHYGETHKGTDYTSVLAETCKNGGATILTETKAVELIQDESGRVVGVKAEGKANDYVINAKGGVVLSTGGFGFNVEMRQKYNTQWPDLGEHVKCSNVPSATGDGILMAQGVGANLVDMEYIQFYPVGDVNTGKLGSTLPGGTDSRIAINKEGKRFMAEDGRRDEQSKAIFAQTDGVCYIVVDADTIDTKEELEEVQKHIESGEVITGATVEEFAANLGVDVAIIQETFDQYNASVDANKDEAFGRVLLKEKMDKGPFYAGLRAPTIHHTMGGIEINANTEVLNTNGEVIKGLYAAGETTGGIHGSNRLGGNALADVMVFGRIAGSNAAKAAK